MIKETIILFEWGRLFSVASRGKLIRRGDYSKEGRGCANSSICNIPVIARVIRFHSVPGVPYLLVLLYLDSFFIDSSPQFLLIIHSFA